MMALIAEAGATGHDRFRARGHADLSVFATLAWLVVMARRVRSSGWWHDHDRNGGGTGK